MSRLEKTSIAANNEDVLDLQRVCSDKSFTATDIIVYGLLLGFGALLFGMSRRSSDFFAGDVTYFELGRSLVENGFYGFDFTPETTLPPGFPAILALLCVTVGCNYAVGVHSMSVFTTLALIASYELLRREEGRAVAASFCLLFASSPMFFDFSTRWVSSDPPYFFTSIMTLLLVTRLDAAKSLRARALLWPLCGFLLAASLLIRSAGIALLIGLFMWLIVSFLNYRRAAMRRLKTFLPILLLGVVVQGVWMQWASKHEVLQWPRVEGYPRSYIAQLILKNGNYPELGRASLSDIPLRMAQNLEDQAVALTRLVTRNEYVNPAWISPLVLCPIILILLGVAFSIGRYGGGLLEWYFLSYETMCLLWPWYGETRFFLVVAPLACLYLWCGGKTLVNVACKRPRAVGALSFPVSALFVMYSRAWGWRSGSAMFWELVTTVSAWMALTGSCKSPAVLASFWARLELIVSAGRKSLTVPGIVGVMTVAALVVLGLFQELAAGRDNLAFDIKTNYNYADVSAGKWIQANTSDTAVVMARQDDVVYHYSHKKVIWFPPSSNPQLLMEGIRKYNVEFVVVTERPRYSYWLPPENICFEALIRSYPTSFHLVHEEPQFRVWRVNPDFSKVG